MRPEIDHGFYGEAHPFFASTNSLVLGVVRDIRGAVEELIHTVANICFDDAAVSLLRHGLDRIAKVSYWRSRLDHRYCCIQAVPRRLYHTDCIRICFRFVPNIICLVDVAVEAVVIKCYINVDDIAIFQLPLVWYAMTDNLVDRCADRFWEVVVVQRGWI